MATSYIKNISAETASNLTRAELLQVTATTHTPFNLMLNKHEAPVWCEQIIRVMPGKRIVLFGTWNQQAIVAKLFFGPRAAQRCQQELTGTEILVASGIPTPRLLYHGTTRHQPAVAILLFEQLVTAHNLDTLWQNKTDPAKLTQLMHTMTIELATQHVLGIVQRDLHLKNFLLDNNQIYTLDGGSICCTHKPLGKKASLQHLALFFSQLGVGTENLQKDLFATYTTARAWVVKPADHDLLNTAVIKWHQQRWIDYQKKLLRNSTAFAKSTCFHSFTMYDRDYHSADFLRFLANPEALFSAPTAQILKAGRSSTVIKVKWNQETWVIKRYNLKNTWHWLRRCIRATRAVKSWQFAHLLRLFGIPTAKPIACIEKRWLGLRCTSYFVMEYLEGENLESYAATYQTDSLDFKKMARRVVQLLKNLKQLHISHGDLKATNIIISHNQPNLLDLDGMLKHKTDGDTQQAYQQEITRFMQNWENHPKVRKLFESLFLRY